MSAFVVKDEQPHDRGVARYQHGIDDEEPVPRHRYPEVWQARVEHVAHCPAFQGPPGHLDAAVGAQAHLLGGSRFIYRAT
jgi:hypothetical protein